MVVSSLEKEKFINYILGKQFTKDELVDSFLESIVGSKKVLKKVHFLSCAPIADYDYKLFFNLRAGTFACTIKGKPYRDRKLIRHILRSIRENNVKVCIMILDNNQQLKVKLKEVCEVSTFNSNVITEAIIDDGLRELNILRLRELIDKSLDEKNEEEFMCYVQLLNELLK